MEFARVEGRTGERSCRRHEEIPSGVRGRKRGIVGYWRDVQCPAGNRGLERRATGEGESEMIIVLFMGSYFPLFWPREYRLYRAATHHCWPRLPTSRADSRTSPGHRSSSGFHEPSPL